MLAFEGRDAQAFLQSQLMNDVAALAPGRWQWNGWLTPKGRVLALFALLQPDPGLFWAVLPDFSATELQPLLQRFVFRSKVTLAVAPVVAASGPSQATPSRDRAAGSPEAGYVLDFGGAVLARSLHLLPDGHPALAPSNEDTDARWLAADLAHGLPRLPASQREAWTPQMLSLERLSAFSLKKGCYPGQEIVARTHYLGQAKRRLVRLVGTGLQAGASVEQGDRTVGTIVCALPNGKSALAVLSADAGDDLAVAGTPCERRDLLAGLARPA